MLGTKINYVFFIVILCCACIMYGQDEGYKQVDYARPGEYIIADVKVTGVEFLDKDVLANMSGLKVGEKVEIPSDRFSDIIKKFWSQGLFSDVSILISKIEKNRVYLNIFLKERPRLSKLFIEGVNNSEEEDLREKLNMRSGSQITENILNNARNVIKDHFTEKGFFNTEINIKQVPDTNAYNKVFLYLDVEKNKRVKIEDIKITGNYDFKDRKIRRVMKNTKERNWNIFKGSKYREDEFKEDKQSLREFYNENGYRDFRIVSDSITVLNEKRIILHINIEEGEQYFFRNIDWVGNTKYPSEILDAVLGIEKGDVYDQTLLQKRLQIDEDAVTSLYMDDGYLFFSVEPVEVNIEGDSIDLEMQIYEGKQATINNVLISGNTKTNEHVIRREIRTKPGELFSKSDIIRTVRELAQLGHFNPETINPNPIPNQSDGTVDIEYQLEEKANDQLEVSGGWGGYGGFVGTIGIRFSNFSAREIFNPNAWRPVPSGDGQTLSVRAQSNGKFMRSYNLTFVEPWLGGKKPNSLSVSLFNQKIRQFNYYTREVFGGSLAISGVSVGFGNRLSWPDDFFTLYNEVSYQRYNNDSLTYSYYSFLDQNGIFNVISFKSKIARSSQDQLIFPRRGSVFSFGVEFTPPYSLFSKGIKREFMEYHKWQFNSKWFLNLFDNLVLYAGGDFGIVGYYNKEKGYPSIGGYQLGGDLMQGYVQYGVDVIPLRGYDNATLTPFVGNSTSVRRANLYDKFTVELRYPFSLNPQATIYGLVFVEGGNGWYDAKSFNPFDIKRSAGVGLRAFLPMFGMLGVDWGYGFDQAYGESGPHRGQFHFTIGQQF